MSFLKLKQLCNRIFQQPEPSTFNITALPNSGGLKSASATVAVASTTGGSQLFFTRGNRVAAYIQNAHATTNLYIGKDTSVTSANGIKLIPGAIFIDEFSTDTWYGIQESGSGDARIIEVTR